MQHNNTDLMMLDLIELAEEANRLRNRGSMYALKRLYAIDREYARRITQAQEDAGWQPTGEH